MKTQTAKSKPSHKIHPPLAAIFSFLFLAILGVAMASLSWQKWPDTLIDFGRELYVPWQLNNGAVLYKDIFHLFGPFSHYFNSWLFGVFGMRLMTLAIFNIGLIILLVYFIYRIFLAATDRLAATLTSAAFLSVFAFSQYVGTGNYNFVCPYAHEVVHGVFLSFLSIYLFLIYLKKPKAPLLGLIAIALGLVSLTKVEIFLAVSTAIFTGLALMIRINKPAPAKILKLSVIFCLGFLLPVIAFLIYFSFHMPLTKALAFLILPYKVLATSAIPSNIFYLRIFGADALLLNLGKLLITSGCYLLILFIFLASSWLVNHIQHKKAKRYTVFIILGIFISCVPFMGPKIPWMEIFRPLPLVMLFYCLHLFVRIFRSRSSLTVLSPQVTLLVFTVFALLLLFKMLLNVHVFHYGFALAMPATLLLVMLILYQLPRLSSRLSGDADFMRALGLVLISITIAAHINITRRIYDLKTYALTAHSDTIKTFNPGISDAGVVINDTLVKIEEFLEHGENFVVFPEGVMLNYLSRRKNPTPYFEFNPLAQDMPGEEAIMESLRRDPPDYIILTEKDTSEYGYRYFGRNYCLKVFSWIRDHYTPVYQSGNTPLSGEGFGVIIAKRSS